MRQRHGRLTFAGSVHFVTTVTAVRGQWFTDPELCRNILTVFEGYRARFELDCFGYVLMPDHIHVLLRQVTNGPLVSKMMEGFKGVTSRTCRPPAYPAGALWARRFDDVPIPRREAGLTRLDYMAYNPVRRGLVQRVEDYVWSSYSAAQCPESEQIVTVVPA